MEINNAGANNNIRRIGSETVHKICSGQVVLSLAVAVKELLENSLDAGAINVDIRLKNYGVDLIEVSDNGSGVTEDNFEALTLKHHTSKLSEYSDLLDVSSFGFRGEALSSLCALANLTITTRHRTAEYASKIQYDHKGNIINKTPCSRQVGTTVTLSNLFCTLPVRQKELHKNVKREFNKLTNLLYAYCLISKGIKITCSNQTNANSKSIVVASSGSSHKDNIASVFGLKQLQGLLEIKTEHVSSIKDNILKGLSGEINECQEDVTIEDIEIDLSEDSNDAEAKDSQESQDITLSQKSMGYKNTPSPVNLEGFISSCEHGCGRSSTDRQYFYVNSRPCEPVKVMKLVNEIYKQFNVNQYPFIFLNINIERVTVDINLSPDKRKVFLTKEKAILDVIKASISKLFESIPRTVRVETSLNLKDKEKAVCKIDQPRIFNSFMQQFSVKQGKESNSVSCTKSINESKNVDLKRKSTSILDAFISKTKRVHEDTDQQQDLSYKKNVIETTKNDEDLEILDNNEVRPDEVKVAPTDIVYLDYRENIPETQVRNVSDVICEESHTIYCKPKTVKKQISDISSIAPKPNTKKVVTDKDEIGKSNRRLINFKTSLNHVQAMVEIYKKNINSSLPERIKFRSSIDPVFNKKCEEELSREISKDSFKQMEILGQFNLGFIITRLEDDLFIIDQHATDEIYNFESLQKSTEITSQKLVIPQQLELSGMNEQILIDNVSIFKKNGFTFDIDENSPPTKRVKLLTIPMSKNWIFGKDDIEELLFMLKESQSEYCRPSRVRAMFASRACRKSVMIGTALSKSDMRKLVDHMAEIDKPWNCPHGRPTIRHLVNIAMVHTSKNQ
ncbi:mismatch repair endonuclease PMS2 isoform X1 [Leptidea sinapis]|uniref:mismatch repair endonuclease PMS2 isoform X1 n=1 Tax=Leptidea sinapis TaxID=189913 RepID=UPI0021C271FA|nr:mismatch repair endonuclease PMS2 isoform X1 [Leptidea sinapis]